MTERDLFDTRIMDVLVPRPAAVMHTFKEKYALDPVQATDWYYAFSQATNYIRMERIRKNIGFDTKSRYGTMHITINLSKPEKDPKDIARARLVPSTNYPPCLLCKENVGYAGNASHPARQNHRIIELDLRNGKYALQYSPYVYYNEHCIILNEEHVPMKIDRETFENLFRLSNSFRIIWLEAIRISRSSAVRSLPTITTRRARPFSDRGCAELCKKENFRVRGRAAELAAFDDPPER